MPHRFGRAAPRPLSLCGAVAALVLAPALAAGRQEAAVARPDLEGIWSSATATPLERPRDLADRPFFTPEEAADFERRFTERNQEPPPDAPRRGTGTYNTFYREYDGGVVATLRTSIVTDPPDGRIPALTPAAEEARRRLLQRQGRMENPEDLGLQDRCLSFRTSGPPMLPYSYNSHYQIIQTERAVVVHAEMIHEPRIVHMDGRSHPPEHIRLWGGHSVGRWEGDTLVVETRNLREWSGLYGPAGGNFAWGRDARVVERFSLLDEGTLLYRFEVDDPTAYVRTWKGELTMRRTQDRIYEYACHEGNYSMEGVLRGARATERGGGGAE